MGRYCSASDLYLQYGKSNIREWADIENDGDAAEVDARIELHCDAAADYVDARLRGAGYVVAFADPVLNDVVYHTARLAGYMVYQGKGFDEEETDQYAMRKTQVDEWISAVRAGRVTLDAERNVTTVPGVLPRSCNTVQ